MFARRDSRIASRLSMHLVSRSCMHLSRALKCTHRVTEAFIVAIGQKSKVTRHQASSLLPVFRVLQRATLSFLSVVQHLFATASAVVYRSQQACPGKKRLVDQRCSCHMSLSSL